MEVCLKRAEPESEAERSFRIDAHVDEYIDHGEAYVVLGGVLYLIEIRYR